MGDRTGIEWTRGADGQPGATWNPIRARNKATGGVGHFCVHASEGCRFCYAERLQPRFRNPVRYAAQDRDKVEIFLDEKVLTQPLRWRRPRKIFPCSMTDLFGEFVTDEMLDRIWAVMTLCPQHTFMPLTKRADRMRAYMTALVQGQRCVVEQAMVIAHQANLPRGRWQAVRDALRAHTLYPLPNVWAGFSAEDQPRFDERWSDMEPLARAGWLTWCSAEPMLGPIDASAALALLRWVVAGGESGPGARPLGLNWVRSIVEQCKAAGVACFVKQIGADPWNTLPAPDGELATAWPIFDPKGGDISEFPDDLRVREYPR